MSTEKPTSRKRAAVFLKAAFQALDEAGGSLPLREVRSAVEQRVELSADDRAIYPKTGYIRWQSVLHFYSIDCVKAGFLKKSNGRWFLTPEGRAVRDKPADEILALAMAGYRVWKAKQLVSTEANGHDADAPVAAERSFAFETAQAQARQEIQDFIEAMSPYEFQDLVAALLRGMGYFTPFVAPPGPDGGTDVIAYQDPLGTKKPHIRVQVKHRKSAKASREDIAALRGIIRQDREIGLFVASGGFTPPAVNEARAGTVHIELIDLERLFELWEDVYDKLSEEDRALLRLRRVSFLSPE